jgi:small-conductance mechanosensitive channel
MKRAKNILTPTAESRPPVTQLVNEVEVSPVTGSSDEAGETSEKILADIAARRLAAQHNRAFSRRKLWLAEPAIAFLIGGSIFWLLAVNGLLYPLLGQSAAGEAGNWLLFVLLGVALIASVGITLSRYRRWGQSRQAGQPLELTTRHLGWRVVTALILAALVIVVLFYGATALAPR